MKKDFYPDRTVCSIQIDLKKLYQTLKKKDLDAETKEIINEMYLISKSIHYKAQRMEKRLIKYRQSIESLGFTRKEIHGNKVLRK